MLGQYAERGDDDSSVYQGHRCHIKIRWQRCNTGFGWVNVIWQRLTLTRFGARGGRPFYNVPDETRMTACSPTIAIYPSSYVSRALCVRIVWGGGVTVHWT